MAWRRAILSFVFLPSVCQQVGSPATGSARRAPAITVAATVLRFGFRGVEVPSPQVEFFTERVDPPSMIAGAETLLICHTAIVAGPIDGNQ